MANYPLNNQVNGEKLRGVAAFGTEGVPLAAKFAAGASLSEAVALDSAIPVRLSLPAGFNGTSIEFQTSHDSATFNDLYDEDGQKVAVAIAASRDIRLVPTDWIGIKAFKLRAMTGGAAQAQDVGRSVVVVAVP